MSTNLAILPPSVVLERNYNIGMYIMNIYISPQGHLCFAFVTTFVGHHYSVIWRSDRTMSRPPSIRSRHHTRTTNNRSTRKHTYYDSAVFVQSILQFFPVSSPRQQHICLSCLRFTPGLPHGQFCYPKGGNSELTSVVGLAWLDTISISIYLYPRHARNKNLLTPAM